MPLSVKVPVAAPLARGLGVSVPNPVRLSEGVPVAHLQALAVALLDRLPEAQRVAEAQADEVRRETLGTRLEVAAGVREALRQAVLQAERDLLRLTLAVAQRVGLWLADTVGLSEARECTLLPLSSRAASSKNRPIR